MATTTNGTKSTTRKRVNRTKEQERDQTGPGSGLNARTIQRGERTGGKGEGAVLTGTILIPPLNEDIRIIPIKGLTPLLCHRFSQKTQQEMLDKHMKKAAKPKAAKDPKECFTQSLYDIGDGQYGFPANGFKAAMVRAGKLCGMTMTDLRQMFFVEPDGTEVRTGEQCVRIIGKPTIHQCVTVIAKGTRDIRIRGVFTKWTANVRIRFDADVAGPAQLVNLLNRAGHYVGVGEWRPERNGIHGTFEVDTEVRRG